DELCDAERTVGLLGADIDVVPPGSARSVGIEKEERRAEVFVLEVAGTRVKVRGVDSLAQIDGREPAKVVVDMFSPRGPQIGAPETTRSRTGEKQPVAVARQGRDVFVGSGVDRGAEIHRRSPRIVRARPLRRPDVSHAVPACAVRAEVQTEAVSRD